MYRAKHGGKAACRLFDPSMKVDALERQELERELRRAVERGELRLFYQPKVSLGTGQIVGMEALVRWQHPQRGLILPSEFMPVAEETGLVNGIGEWVLQEAAVHAREWRPEHAGEQPLLMSANLSARQFQDPRLVETVASALRWARIEPWRLTLEITEDVAMENAEQALETLRQLKELGVRLAFDDFGTGRSSLRYLKQFPIDTLKIARSSSTAWVTTPTTWRLCAASSTLPATCGATSRLKASRRPSNSSCCAAWAATGAGLFLRAAPDRRRRRRAGGRFGAAAVRARRARAFS